MPVLQPRDEAAKQPEFLAFRRQLQDAIRRKDADAVLRVAEPGVQIDFGGGEGIEFLRAFIKDPNQDFWGEFSRALAMGGTFDEEGGFSAPYVYSAWPEEFDSYECLAVTGTAVRLHAGPDKSSLTLRRLNFDIVEQVDSSETPGWRRVRLASGQTGYVASEFVRSPIDYRAWFVRTGSGWRLRAFVAGD